MKFQNSAEKVSPFLETKTRRELAEILEVKYTALNYNLFFIPDEKKYKEFQIKKRKGGNRKIVAPNSGIKTIQKRLSQILLEIYPEKACVHGFVKSKSIISNAQEHVHKKILINLDLQDFFPSINFGRVRGIFLAHPFHFNESVATTLAQICCHDGVLPQGAPTSPIISNFICRRMDNNFIDIISKHKCTYTRYADDITISTNLAKLPKAIGTIKNHKIVLSKSLIDIIKKNGFKVNDAKVRFASQRDRQDVTGLIVNKKLNVNRKYIRNVRAILHAWEKFGKTKAAETYFEKNELLKVADGLEKKFERSVVGKINFIRSVVGDKNDVYIKLANRIKSLNPHLKLTQETIRTINSKYPNVYGEGKTDTKHLESALRKFRANGKYNRLKIAFQNTKPNTNSNNSTLLELCENLSKGPEIHHKVICIFDRDDERILKQVVNENADFKNWGNNVFSFAIPKPAHRDFDEVCIEHYYLDTEIMTLDKSGRRLFLSSEFNEQTARHKVEDLNYNGKKRLQNRFPFIIDNSVYDKNANNVALSKDDFANNILMQENGFENFTFEHFNLIFDIVEQIIST